jgi:glycosyltransferase involved in cell wall biosynthesis
MSAAPSLALIVSTFNQPDYLARVLQALDRQCVPASEVILADDGSADDSGRLFRDWSEQQRFRCEHVWQAHEGFRKARILNEAIARSRSEYLVFVDGDTLPHPMFLSDHCRLAQHRTFVQGHRALVQEKAAASFGLSGFNRDRRRAFWRGQLRGLKGVYRWPLPWRRWREDWRQLFDSARRGAAS